MPSITRRTLVLMGDRMMLAEVAAAYSEQRGRSMGASTLRLRWWERRLARTCGLHSQPGLARLKAIRDELRDRREWVTR